MRYRAIIVEDELPARITLKSYISKYSNAIDIVGEFETVKSSLEFIANNNVQIIFVDVQLKDGLGTKLLESINTGLYKIIFTTAYTDYTFEAFKHKAFGYLLKPINPNDYKEIINRVIISLSAEEAKKSVKIPLSSGHKLLNIENIIRCEAESNYTKIYINQDDNKCLTISKTLKYVEHTLLSSNLFVRVHQSHLVNTMYIKDPEIKSNAIVLTNGDKVPISRTRKLDLFSRLSYNPNE
ncbi:MAG: LytR/AlgR family response regulator transcription factor [Bacteroidia bacterium]